MKLDKAFFASTNVVPKKVKLEDGTEHELLFRELPTIEFRRFALLEQSVDDDKRAESTSYLIAASLVDEQGNPVLTVEQANNLTASATGEIVKAILEVNGASKSGEQEKG